MSAILDRVEPRLQRAFLQMIERIRGALGPESVESMIKEGRIRDAESIYERAAALFAREVNAVYLEGGRRGAEFLKNALDVVTGFDQFSERAVARVREKGATLIREFTQGQREVVRATVENGLARGINPVEQAREFRDSIGLTVRQQEAVDNYRRLLTEGSREALERDLRDRRYDGTVDRSIESGEPLSEDQIDRMVGRYRERAIKRRAETIARHESLQALHEGMEESFEQVLETGGFTPDQVTTIWNTANDNRVRDAHEDMNGQERALGEKFEDGDGNLLAFPGDPEAPLYTTIQCRCVRSMRVSLGENVRVKVEQVASVGDDE